MGRESTGTATQGGHGGCSFRLRVFVVRIPRRAVGVVGGAAVIVVVIVFFAAAAGAAGHVAIYMKARRLYRALVIGATSTRIHRGRLGRIVGSHPNSG